MRLDLNQKSLKATLWPFVFTIFFVVSGGPLGLEPLIAESGPGLALWMILLAPLVYAIPSALMTAEMSAMMPVNGGYYHWVKHAFGEGPGFLCAFWTLVYAVLDTALYPVLATQVLHKVLLNQMGVTALESSQTRFELAAVIVLIFAGVNLLGIRSVGKVAIALAIILVVPFFLMIVLGIPGLFQSIGTIGMPFVPEGSTVATAASAGMAVVIWNYLGWDSLSTVSGEVEDAPQTIPKALGIALPAIVGLYLLSTLVGLSVSRDSTEWVEGFWPVLAGRVGGPWLGQLMAICQVASTLGLFTATLLGASRIPHAFAKDGLLPRALTRIHPKLGTPVFSILLVASLVLFLVQYDFEDLVEADVMIYTLALLMEFAALAWLRYREPYRARPYVIPGGWPMIALVCLLPLGVMIFLVKGMVDNLGMVGVWLGILFVASGPAAYGFACLYRRNRVSSESDRRED